MLSFIKKGLINIITTLLNVEHKKNRNITITVFSYKIFLLQLNSLL